MKILAVTTKQSLNEINTSIVEMLKFLGHEVILFDYIEIAMKYGRPQRDPILLRAYYEQKPDIIFLSKGHTISPEMVQKVSKKTPLLFWLWGSFMTYRMHPEVNKFAELSNTMVVDNINSYNTFLKRGIENLYLINKNHETGEYEMKATEKTKVMKEIDTSKYASIKVKKKDKKDVGLITNLRDTILSIKEDITENRGLSTLDLTFDDLLRMDSANVETFRTACSTVKLFIAENGFKEKNSTLYNKMLLCGTLVLEESESNEETLTNLLRYHMKRRSLINKNLSEIKESTEIIEEDESKSISFDSIIKELVDVVLQSNKN